MKKYIFTLLLICFNLFAQTNFSSFLRYGAVIKAEPQKFADVIKLVGEKEIIPVKFIGFINNEYYIIIYDNKTCYVREMYIHEDDYLKSKPQFDSLKASYEKLMKEVGLKNRAESYQRMNKYFDLKAKPENPKIFYKNFFSVKGKDEFETTQNFNRRILYDSNKITNFDYYPNPTYNSDNQSFVLMEKDIYSDYYVINLLSETKFLREYTASNSFNVKAKVRVYSEINYKVILTNCDNLKNDKGDNLVNKIVLPYNITDAKNIKSNIIIRFGITFKKYTDREYVENHQVPTITSPTEYYTKDYLVTAIVKFVIIYDKRNKKILDLYY